MSLTNAERQADWRRRRDEQIRRLRVELDQLRNERAAPENDLVQRLRAEVDQLRNELRAQKAASAPSGDRMQEALRRTARVAKQVPPGDPARIQADQALQYAKEGEARLRSTLMHLDKKLAKIPAVARRRKIEALAARPGTDGEHAAALAALRRLP